MIRKRLTDSRPVVSLQDPALFGLSRETLKKYELSRDMADLGDLSALSEKPTIFHCEPLRVEHEHYLDILDSAIMWRIFSVYVKRVENLDGIAWKESNGETRIDDACRDMIPRDTVVEISTCIIQAASKDGAAVPFSSRGISWEETRGQALISRALSKAAAPTEQTA